jgi:predicted RNase H-like nuclease (RuvC/YqgF family)
VSDKNYYESIINARANRIEQMDGSIDAKKAVLKDLDNQYEQYSREYGIADAEIQSAESMKKEKFAKIDKKIKENEDRINKLREEAASLENTFGHHGKTLVDCLRVVKSFGQSLKDGTSAYSPIYTILNGNCVLKIDPMNKKYFV